MPAKEDDEEVEGEGQATNAKKIKSDFICMFLSLYVCCQGSNVGIGEAAF